VSFSSSKHAQEVEEEDLLCGEDLDDWHLRLRSYCVRNSSCSVSMLYHLLHSATVAHGPACPLIAGVLADEDVAMLIVCTSMSLSGRSN
jgi:hypothetical protein